MLSSGQYAFCSEFYVIEKTIEVVVTLRDESVRIRIDALRDDRTGKYSTKAYIEEHLTIQPTYPQTLGSYDRKPEDFRMWVAYDLPWTHRDTADGALEQALGFLEEYCGG